MKELFNNVLLFLRLKSQPHIYFDSKSMFGQAIDEYFNEMVPPYVLEPVEYYIIENLFNAIRKNGFIEFRYPQNDCQYRAHGIARFLLEYGVKSNKIWSFKPALVGKKETHELTIPDPNFPGDLVTWAFHVAPVVLVKYPDNKTELLALDPSMFDKPVSYTAWLNKLDSKKQYYTFVHSKFVQYVTDENNVLNGIWNSDAYSVDMQWITSSINRGKIFYSYLLHEVFPLEEKLRIIQGKLSTTKSEEERIALEAEKKSVSELYLERKNIAINSDRFEHLPIEYQNRMYEFQNREIDGLCWENIEILP